MAQTPFNLILRRVTHYSQNAVAPPLSSSFYQLLTSQRFSTSEAETSPSSPKPSSLSARLAFVYEQIDAIEKERAEKDQTLQRIRAWRESKNAQTSQNHEQIPEVVSKVFSGNECNSDAQLRVSETDPKFEMREGEGTGSELGKKEVELVHPWPEWIELMERLVQQNYFDHMRKDEDKMVQHMGFDADKVRSDESFEFIKDFKTVQTACLNFGKDRFDILRSLSRKDIQLLVGLGCPNVDKKVVFSAKLLRKLVHLDEGDVCSSCSLRTSCERGYLLTNKEDEARTIDIMRVLSTFGFDPGNGPVTNKQLLKHKSIRTVIRKLLHEVVKLSSVPIDPNLPPPVIKRPPPKVKQPPPPPRRRIGRDDIEMKKGDWLCPKCDFMNFAKNTVCLQCDANRPKRELLPGEWECPECKFLNYRRNVVCFHCDCKRPPVDHLENNMRQKQLNPKQKLDKVANRSEVSNAWNFDFDDDESDGADVAAFEYADSRTMNEDSPLSGHSQGNFRGPEGDFKRVNRAKGFVEEEIDDAGYERPGVGFNDFDDEDDIDSYEIETQSSSPRWKASTSEAETYSGGDFEDSDAESFNDRRSGSIKGKAAHSMRRRPALSEDDGPDFDPDEDLPVHPNWKSTHVADAKQITKNRVPRGSRKLNFGSDEELGLSSDDDGGFNGSCASGPYRGEARNAERKHSKGRAGFDIKADSLSGSELENDGSSRISKRNRGEISRRGYSLKADKNGHERKMSSDRGRGRHQFNGSSRGGPPKQQQRRLGRYDQGGDFGGFGNFRPGPPNQQQRRSDKYDKNKDFGEFRNNIRGLPKQQRRNQERREHR